MGSAIFFCSDSEHKMEGELLKWLRQTKEAGGSASLTFTTRDGKMKAKLEVELDPPRYLLLLLLVRLHPHLRLHLLQEEVAAGEKALLPR